MVQIGSIFSLVVDEQAGSWRLWLLVFARFSFLALLLLISFISLVSGDVGDVEAVGLDDKIAHILAYVAFMGAGLFSLRGPRYRPVIFIALFIYSSGLELGQQLFADGREGSIADALANLFGLLLGTILSKPMGYVFCWLGTKWSGETR